MTTAVFNDAAPAETADLVIVGAGAAGLATALFCRRRASDLRVVCLDSAPRVGAKILISGGSRCNVTNRIVTERDFWGGPRRVVRNVLRAFPASRAVAFFAELGVALHEEEEASCFLIRTVPVPSLTRCSARCSGSAPSCAAGSASPTCAGRTTAL